MSILSTHRMCRQTHCLTMIRDKEIQLESTVDRILDLHLRFGKRNLNEESPKSVRPTVMMTETAVCQELTK